MLFEGNFKLENKVIKSFFEIKLLVVIDCRCELFEKILGCLYIISICASDLLVSYRVYALYIKRTGVVIFLAILKVAVLAGCTTVLPAEEGVPTTLPTNHCVHGRPASYAFLSAAIPLLSDTLIFLLLIFLLLRTESHGPKSFFCGTGLSPLSKMMLRHAQIYFM